MMAKSWINNGGIMKNQELAKKLVSPSKNSRLETFGRTITFLCLALIVFIVAMILIFVAQKGLSTFFVDKINFFDFLFGKEWQPSVKMQLVFLILGRYQ